MNLIQLDVKKILRNCQHLGNWYMHELITLLVLECHTVTVSSIITSLWSFFTYKIGYF
jgi:hypothetical protein